MKKKSNISFGPGAASLILIFVVLTLSVLSMLSLMNARGNIQPPMKNAWLRFPWYWTLQIKTVQTTPMTRLQAH